MARSETELLQRLLKTEGILRDILGGGKPALDPCDPDTGWLFDQITRMHAGNFLSSVPASYVTRPTDTPEDVAHKGDTRFHLMPERLLFVNGRLRDELAAAGIRNFYVPGADYASREPALNDDGMPISHNLVFTPGDLYALYNFVKALSANIAADKEDKKLLVIQNVKDFWRPLVDGLSLLDCPQEVTNLIVTATPEDTTNALLYSGKDIGAEPLKVVNPFTLSKGAVMAFGSTQPKKADETRQIAAHDKMMVDIRDAIEYLHWFLSAEEVSKTYEGNAYEKVSSLLDRIYNYIGYDRFCARLREEGIDPEKIIFTVNDTGLSLTPNLSMESEFDQSRHEVIPGKNWPDVEFGPIVDSQGGLKPFAVAVKQACGRLGVLPRYRDTQLYMCFKLAPARESVKVFGTFGIEEGYWTSEPRPADTALFTTENFCIPEGQLDEHLGKTKAELGDRFLLTNSSQARELRGLAHAAQIPSSVKSSFLKAVGMDPRCRLRLMTQDNVVLDVNGHGRDGLSKTVRDENWKLSARKFKNFKTFSESADAFLLTAHSQEVLDHYDDHYPTLMRLFWDLIPHKQIMHDAVYKKPVWIQNPPLPYFNENGAAELDWSNPAAERKFLDYVQGINPADHPWGQALLLYRYYFENALIKQQPRYLMTQLKSGSDDELSVVLRTAREDHQPCRAIDYEREIYGRDRTDLFEVTVLGSAGTKNPIYKKSAEFLGYEAGKNGMHVRTGGGMFGVMGGVAEGMRRFRAENPDKVASTHISGIQMPRTLQFEGLCFDLKEMSDTTDKFIAVEPGMEPRMRSLFRSHAIVMDAGGAGTLEEFFMFLAMKVNNDPLVRNKKIIIVNHQHQGPGHLRLYDPLLATIPEKYKKDIIVVPDTRQAMNQLLTIRSLHNMTSCPPRSSCGLVALPVPAPI